MMFAAVALVVLQAGPDLRLEDCPAAWVDVRLVKAQLALEPTLPEGVVTGRCGAGATVRLEFGGAVRELTLSGASAGQRERTLALFIATWLARPREVDAGVVGRGRALGGAGTGPGLDGARSVASVGDAGTRTSDARSAASPGDAGTRADLRDSQAALDAGTVATFSDAGTSDVLVVAPLPDPLPPVGARERSLDAGASPVPVVALETEVPIELAVVPGVGINRLFSPPTMNYLAFGLLGVSSQRLDGLGIGPLSLVDTRTRGAQFGVYTRARELQGLQLGLVTNSDTVQGVQLGLASVSERSRGFQFGAIIASASKDLVGVQLGFGLNRARASMLGVQLGTLNVTEALEGVQFGLINVADDLTGLQLGLVNVARTVKGTQIGLVNFSSNGPAPVGIFNVTDDAPMRLALTLGDTHLINVALKSGGTRFYGLLSLGWVPRAAIRAGGGFGVHFNKVDKLGWFFQLELTSHAILNLEAPTAGFIASLALGTNLGYRLGPHISFILGPQFNLLFGNPGFPGKSASLFGITANGTGLGVAPGLQFGVEL